MINDIQNDKEVHGRIKISHVLIIVYSIYSIAIIFYLSYLSSIFLDPFFPRAVTYRNGVTTAVLIVFMLLTVICTWMYRLPFLANWRFIIFIVTVVLLIISLIIEIILGTIPNKKDELTNSIKKAENWLNKAGPNDLKAVSYFLSKTKGDYSLIFTYFNERCITFGQPVLGTCTTWAVFQAIILVYLFIIIRPVKGDFTQYNNRNTA